MSATDEFHIERDTEADVLAFADSTVGDNFPARVGIPEAPEYWVWFVLDRVSTATPEAGSVIGTASGNGRFLVISEENAWAVRNFMNRQGGG